jgi:hypothetical protein
MKRKSGGRSYFQQLAQPVLPGETVLTARPVSAAYANETAPQVPVIEDRFNFPDNELSPRRQNSARAPIDQVRPVIEASDDPAKDHSYAVPSTSEPRRAVTHQFDLPRASAEPGQAIQSVQHIEPSSPSTLSPQAHSAHNERLIEQPARKETHKVIADSRESEISRIAPSRPHEISNAEEHAARPEQKKTAPAARESVEEPIVSSKPAKDVPAPHLVPQDDPTRRKEIVQASEALAPVPAPVPAAKGKPEVRSSQGPRVHIGTVEIRAVLPQPVVPQAVTMAPNMAQNNTVAQARGHSGAAEPLARGLDWSYGLVQG